MALFSGITGHSSGARAQGSLTRGGLCCAVGSRLLCLIRAVGLCAGFRPGLAIGQQLRLSLQPIFHVMPGNAAVLLEDRVSAPGDFVVSGSVMNLIKLFCHMNTIISKALRRRNGVKTVIAYRLDVGFRNDYGPWHVHGMG